MRLGKLLFRRLHLFPGSGQCDGVGQVTTDREEPNRTSAQQLSPSLSPEQLTDEHQQSGNKETCTALFNNQ